MRKIFFLKKENIHIKSMAVQISLLLMIMVLPLNILGINATEQHMHSVTMLARQNMENASSYVLSELKLRTSAATSYVSGQIFQDETWAEVMRQQNTPIYQSAKNMLGIEFARMSKAAYAGDIFFMYSSKLDDFMINHRYMLSLADKTSLIALLKENAEAYFKAKWSFLEVKGQKFLVHTYKRYGMYFGALVCLDNIESTLIQMTPYASCLASVDTEKTVSEKAGFLSTTTAFSDGDFYIHTSINANEVYKGLSFIQRTQKYIAYVYLALFPVLLAALYAIIVRPLRRIERALRHFRNGDAEYRIRDRAYSTEVDMLQQSYNDMADHIEQLKIENYEKQLAIQQVRLENFQLTIRPHFLQNTFALMYTLSQQNEPELLGDFILYMSSYFRSVYHGIDHFISLDDELNLVESYVKLASMQYPNMVSFESEVADGCRDIPVPSLMIHNFIENATCHAFTKTRVLHISLSADIRGSYLHVTVSDDGVGIPPEYLERINSGAALETENGRRHTGLHNSWHRLRIIYNRRALLNVKSEMDKGTVIELLFPSSPE